MECVECGQRADVVQRTGRPRRYCSRSCQARAYRRRRDSGRLSATGRRGPANHQHATELKTAIAIADMQGIASVTLRSVAAQAGVTLAETRRTFGSRDRLLAMMVQHILSQCVQPPPSSETPTEALCRLAEAEWRSYRVHPWLVEVVASTRPPLVPPVLDNAHSALEAFVATGLDVDTAFVRYLAFSGYIQGMALLLSAEHRESSSSGITYRNWWADEAARLDRTGARAKRPWLSELLEKAPSDTFDADTAFRGGLGLIIHGLTDVH